MAFLKNRGQALFEFMMVAAIVSLYLGIFTIVYAGQNANIYAFSQGLEAKSAAEVLALASNAAYIAGNGSTVGFSILNATQNVSIAANRAQVRRLFVLMQSGLVTSTVAGDLSSGEKTASNDDGNVTVR